MNREIDFLLKNSKSLNDLALAIFGKKNQNARNKCKQILKENGIEWEKWLEDKKVKPKRYCLNCGKEIRGGDGRKKFCNHSCAASYNNLGVSRSKKNKQHTTCLNCGKRLTINQELFCCHKCQGDFEYRAYIEKWLDGKESGSVDTGYMSARIRRFLFEKYNNSCQICGWNKEHPSTHKVPLQIHHIDGDCKNNKKENLQLLCPNCHSLTETFGALNVGNSTRNK